MGWTFKPATCFLPSGQIDVQQMLDTLYNCDGYTVLQSTLVGGHVYYAAIQTPTGEVEAIVALTSRASCLGYKTMSEREGPDYHDCPESILDILTATNGPFANKWRSACRQRLSGQEINSAK